MRIPVTFRMPSAGILEKGFLGILLMAIIYSVYDRLEIQPFWDEPKIYLRPLFDLLDDPLAYFRGPITSRDRPIGIHLLYAPFLWIFGESMYLIRILSTFYFITGMWFFYLALKTERITSYVVLLLFLLIPIVRVYIPQFVGDPQLFSLFALYFFFITSAEKKTWALIATGFFAGLVREPAIAMVPATLTYFYLRDKKITGRDVLISLAPALGLLVHLLRNFIRTGEFFNHVTIQTGDFNLLAGLDVRVSNITQNLLGVYCLIPLLIVSILILSFFYKRLKFTPKLGFSLVIVLSYIAVFSGLWICLPRYFLSSIPFLIYLLTALVLSVLTSWKAKAAFILFAIASILTFPQIINSQNGQYGRGIGPQDTLKYPGLAKIHYEVIGKVKNHLSEGDSIASGWPFLEILKTTRIGYGPMKNFNMFTTEDPLPDAIIWTNFPEQIRWSYVEAQLRTADYEETDYSFGFYRVKLFLKKNR